VRYWKVTTLIQSRENITEYSVHIPGRADAKRFMDRAVKQHGDALLSVKMYKPDGNLFMNWNRTIEHAGDTNTNSDSDEKLARDRLGIGANGAQISGRSAGASAAYGSVSSDRVRYRSVKDGQ